MLVPVGSSSTTNPTAPCFDKDKNRWYVPNAYQSSDFHVENHMAFLDNVNLVKYPPNITFDDHQEWLLDLLKVVDPRLCLFEPVPGFTSLPVDDQYLILGNKLIKGMYILRVHKGENISLFSKNFVVRQAATIEKTTLPVEPESLVDRDLFSELMQTPAGQRLKNHPNLLHGLLTDEASKVKDLFTTDPLPIVAKVSSDMKIEIIETPSVRMEKSFNRMCRIFKEMNMASAVMIVTFEGLRDISPQKRSTKDIARMGDFIQLCCDGIKHNGRNYVYFTTSNSGLKGESCIFIDSTTINLEKLCEILGDFSKSQEKGFKKLMSRIGLNVGTSIQSSVTLEKHQYLVVYDEYEYPGVDGINLVEESFFYEILNGVKGSFIEHDAKHITAFQGRVLGIKGVFQLIPTQFWENTIKKRYDFSDNNIKVVVRDSTIKFGGGEFYRYFDILNYSVINKGNISRHVISFLLQCTSKKEQMSKYFLDHYERSIDEWIRKASDREYICNQLLSDANDYQSQTIRSLVWNGISLKNPLIHYFLTLKIRDQKILGLLTERMKARIEYDYLINTMGVIDESGTLKEDEVYIPCPKIAKTLGNMGLSKMTHVIVFRYPIAHEADIRKLRVKVCTDNQFLLSRENCIVFPKLKDKKSPHQLMGGGDLDGDLYNVIFDPVLVDLFDKEIEPIDYPDAKLNASSTPKNVLPLEESRKRHARFFIKFENMIGLYHHLATMALYFQRSDSQRRDIAKAYTDSIDSAKHDTNVTNVDTNFNATRSSKKKEEPPFYTFCGDLENNKMMAVTDKEFEAVRKSQAFEEQLLMLIFTEYKNFKIPLSHDDDIDDGEYGVHLLKDMEMAFSEYQAERVHLKEAKDRSQKFEITQHKKLIKKYVQEVSNLENTKDKSGQQLTLKCIVDNLRKKYFSNSPDMNMEQAWAWVCESYKKTNPIEREFIHYITLPFVNDRLNRDNDTTVLHVRSYDKVYLKTKRK